MVHIIRTGWQGTTGGPGLTQLAVDQITSGFGPLSAAEGQAAVNAVRAFWDSTKLYLPNELTLTVSPVVDYYLTDTAELAGSMTAATAPANVIGADATNSYSMASGLKLNLNTGVIRNGRRVRGSIFVVPSAGSMTNAGIVGATPKTNMQTYGATLISALNTAGLKLVVWSRPLTAEDPNGPRDGAQADVSVIECSEKTAVLRGRRD